jgi:DNA-binding transcriptional LysR family regulator
MERIALADLANEQWLVSSHRPPYADAYEIMCRIAGFEPTIAFRADDHHTLQGLVAAGIGVSLIPALSLNPHRDDIVATARHSELRPASDGVDAAGNGTLDTGRRPARRPVELRGGGAAPACSQHTAQERRLVG